MKKTWVGFFVALFCLLAVSCSQLQLLLTLTPPSTPAPIAVGTVTTTSIELSWPSVAGATSYQLYRDSSATGSFTTQIYDGRDTGFTDSGLTPNATFFYEVKATNASGSSSPSPVVSVTSAT